MPVYKVQKEVPPDRIKTAAGQKIATIGQVWLTVAKSTNKTVAERTAIRAGIDNPNARIRIEPPTTSR